MKRIIYSILSGILLALSWPTYGFPFLLFTAFVPLLLLEHEITQKKEKYSDWKVFGFTYISFLIWNYGATQWLHFSQNPDGSFSWIAFIFPLVVNSFLMSFTFTLFHFIKRKGGTWSGLIFFPVIWICFEKTHLNWELSWPWLNLGNAFADYPQSIQWYEATGTFGGTLWVLVVNEILFYYIRTYQVTGKRAYIWKLTFYCILFIGIPIAISLLIYQSYKEISKQKLEVVLAQPALDPYNDKYSQDGEQIVENLLSSIEKDITPNTSYVVSPETAFPGKGFISINNLPNDPYIEHIKNWMRINNPNLTFVSGASLFKEYTTPKTSTVRYIKEGNYWVDLYNSAIQIDLSDEVQYYNKSKLVVGVEHFPYSKILKPIVGNYMLDFGGTMESLGTQEHPTVFHHKKNEAKIAPIICYESIYGEYVGGFVRRGANVLFIMTNDSWWSDSQGHKQLLSYARLRAIETRRDIARSANSGISAFINQRGDIEKRLGYGVRGALKGEVNLNTKLTFYVKYGDWIARVSFIISGIIIAYVITKNIIEHMKIKRNAEKYKILKNKN